ncbi:MAG: sigma-54-dependent Fis family transcriptional regulator [Candidatus Tectomicrobia bacterium]|uniref:Sigma-54-dependent Fis family transcriptional regulator n=1 Tax=Tectimicrobiota bacterium TaxID=2528274 RepID=A0A932GNE5_UNCTE|nr:sigma-54-dependent Fis family transcriptional regulator [Candidatus Tectomicrobia bacterium]
MLPYEILIVDDEKLIRWSLSQALEKEGYHVLTAEDGEQGLALVKEEDPDLVILDVKLPGLDGLQVLEKIREFNPGVVVIMLTAFDALEIAVGAMKLGAYDYIHKPYELEKVQVCIKNALETVKLKKEVQQLQEEQSSRYGFKNIIGQTENMRQVFETVRLVARSDTTTVLLQGESGTGKDLIAKAIHYQSSRRDHPFMEIDCTSLPESLAESELFGHEKGAFTDAKVQKKGLFELANGGTVLLDEIGDMPLGIQSKLLRILEERTCKRVGGVRDIKVDVRVIAATHVDLEKAVTAGKFREDLYYRLKVIPIYIPPLRERRDDIPLLAKYFVHIYSKEFKKKVKGLSAETIQLLLEYDWPGNVRELRNVVERAIILGNEDWIMPDQLPREIFAKTSESAREEFFRLPGAGVNLEEVEKALIAQALSRTLGNQIQAAKLLGISRDTLRYRMKKYNLGEEEVVRSHEEPEGDSLAGFAI